MMKKKTHEEYVQELAISNPDIEVVEKYINATTPIEHYCKKHNVFWNTSPVSILRGSGCKECGKEKIRGQKRKLHAEYIEEVKKINPDIEVKGEYKGANTPILHRCKIDGYEWNVTPSSLLCGHGCPMCAGNVKKTHEQYIVEVAKINPLIEVIGQYINASTPIAHRCKIDEHIWKTAPYAILRGDRCPKCAGNAKKTQEEYIQELSILNPDIEVVEQYIGALVPILHHCKIDGNDWYASPANILSGRGCPECKARILSDIFVNSHEPYVAEIAAINPNIEVLEKYINSHTPILHRCKKDGYAWKIEPANILSGQGCPQCQESIGERKVRQWLEKNNIEYIYQKKFKDCRDKKELPFDFYIPSYNTCIEYDGIEHFEPIDFAGKGKDWVSIQFKKTKLHDEIKNQYCINNNIRLLRIPYYKNVEEELEYFLFI